MVFLPRVRRREASICSSVALRAAERGEGGGHATHLVINSAKYAYAYGAASSSFVTGKVLTH